MFNNRKAVLAGISSSSHLPFRKNVENVSVEKINNIRDLYSGINDMKKRYQPRTRIINDEKGDLVADSHSIMERWRNYFSQILNVHGVSDVRQAEIHTAELLVPEPSAKWLLKS